VPPRAERTVTAPHEFASVRKPIERESVFQIEVEKIRPNPYQPRRAFHDGGLAELTSSIRDFGVLQPLVVTKREQETAAGTEVFYELVAGERRLLAAKRAGLERVPAVVKAVDSHRAKLEMALIENLQRSDLTPLETARAYTRLQEEFGLTQREIGERVGKSREAVANTLRLLNLSPEAQSALAEGKLNETQARTLLSVEAPDARAKLFADFLAGRGGRVGVPRVRSGPTPVSPEDAATARALEERLSAPVRVVRKGKGGRIEITFYSDEEYLGVRSRLLGEEW
jgi:ParB family chromosome partitioning protein